MTLLAAVLKDSAPHAAAVVLAYVPFALALGAALVAVVVVNARHLLYGVSLAPHTRGWSTRTRGAGAFLLADPVYALAIARFERPDHGGSDTDRLGYYTAVGLTCWTGWLLLTGAGGLLAGALPTALPLHLAAPLTFLQPSPCPPWWLRRPTSPPPSRWPQPPPPGCCGTAPSGSRSHSSADSACGGPSSPC